MDNAFRMISDIVTSLTGILVGLVGLGVVGGVVFGDMHEIKRNNDRTTIRSLLRVI